MDEGTYSKKKVIMGLLALDRYTEPFGDPEKEGRYRDLLDKMRWLLGEDECVLEQSYAQDGFHSVLSEIDVLQSERRKKFFIT